MKNGSKEVKIYFHYENTIEYKCLIKNWDINKIWFNVTYKFTDSSAKIEKTTHIILKKGAFKTGFMLELLLFI